MFTLNSIAVELFEVSCTFYVNFSELASRFEDWAAIQKLSSEFVMIKLGVGRNLFEINFCIKTLTSAFNEHYNEFSCVTYFFFQDGDHDQASSYKFSPDGSYHPRILILGEALKN